MTKKSAGRLARDKIKKDHAEALTNNTCWDDLNAMYNDMKNLLVRHAHLHQFASDKNLIAAVEDKITLANNIRILANDLKTLNDDLANIHALHADKTGGSTDPDEIIGSIGIFEQYNLFMERHEAVVMPTAYHIIEQFDQAEKVLISNAKAAEDLNNPNVISDAEIVDFTKTDDVVTGTIVENDKVIDFVEEIVSEVKSVPAPDFNKLKNSFDSLHPEIKQEEQNTASAKQEVSNG